MNYLNRRTINSALAIVVLTSALAACGSTEPVAESESAPAPVVGTPAPDTITEGMGSGQADGVFPREVEHFLGTTTIESQPERIVVLGTGQMDVLSTFGVVPVGSTTGDGADIVPAYLSEALPDLAEDFAEVQSVGSRQEPDIEAIAELDPDLILLNAAQAEDSDLFELASAIAPTVATEGTGFNWKQDMLLAADVIGRVDAAGEWLGAFETEAAALGESVDDEISISIVRLNADRLRVYGFDSFAGSVLTDAGIGRPEAQQFADTSEDISSEQLDLAEGDWIFYGVQGDPTELTDLPLWSSLTAVSADQAVQVNDDPWFLNAGPSAAQVVLAELESTLGG